MKHNFKRELIRNNVGKTVKFSYYNNKDIIEYDGVLTFVKFESNAKFAFNGKISFSAGIKGKDGIKFPILPLDSSLHNMAVPFGKNGYWEVKIVNEQ